MSTASRVARWIWEENSLSARAARAALAPASALFAIGVARRNAKFDEQMKRALEDLRSAGTKPIAAISIGNLTVGGTGKTPVAAWCAKALLNEGAKPALVMRGYGDDEWRVHMLLNPGVPVFVAAERRDGMLVARTKGADCVVLDDAFQHRQAPRIADVVLVSADLWNGRTQLLPAGPFREPMTSLRRADVVVVTVKAAQADRVDAVVRAIESAAPSVPIAVARLELGELRLAAALPDVDERGIARGRKADVTGILTRSMQEISNSTFVVTAGIGDPHAFSAQLARTGASMRLIPFSDHHAFSAADAEMLARAAAGTDGVICTLKDAVKLVRIWPRFAPPLWYVSQSVVVERGAPALDRALARVLTARVATAPTVG